MIDLLADNPIIVLFGVIAAGALLSRVRIGGFSFGIAGVLFAGIAVGAIDPRLKLPDELWTVGLALFVYTVGLAAGPGFVASLRRRGVGANLLVIACLAVAAAVSAGVGVALLSLGDAVAPGVFSGSQTNTPALAASIEALQDAVPADAFDRASADAIAGYSLTYPLGVIIPLLAVFWLARRRGEAAAPAGLVTATVMVERGGLPSLGEIRNAHAHEVVFGRVLHDGTQRPAFDDAVPTPGDLVTVVGRPAPVATVVDELGARSEEAADLDRHEVDFRRIIVSRRELAGQRIGDIDLQHRLGGTITRVRRGDADLVADPAMELELGDSVRVVAPRNSIAAITAFFGDSYRSLGEIDVLPFAAGLALGLCLGLVPFPLPGGGDLTLGAAGGPLVVALCLGAIGRTGPFIWQIPHGANLTLRQFGVVIFLAGIGTRAGGAFGDAIVDSRGIVIIATGTLATAASVGLALVVGMKLLRLPAAGLAGVIAGIQTQPAVLAFACEREADDREVNLGYASVYPLAVIAKIVVAQVLVRLLIP